MNVKEHPDYGRLLAAMKLAVARVHPWVGTIYRSAPPKWAAGRDLLAGVGSMKSGARFNAPGSFPAVYGSTTPELAMIESLAYQRRAGLPIEHALPLVFKAISVQVDRLLDLTDATVLTDLAVTLDQLRVEAWWLARACGEESLTQVIGRTAHACGVQALLTDSAHTLDHGHNIIVLPDHLPASKLKVLRGSAKK
ncbi:MAG TPA: RES family NAD+ phosphorylase [Tepidisphaeraceae bacterium]|nr:RES family NAD+ phosphorylase [Tepidisphaeraceae bacterium]